jgi:hypothetical protein
LVYVSIVFKSQVWWYTLVIQHSGGGRIQSSRPVWAAKWDPVSKTNKQKKNLKGWSKWILVFLNSGLPV